jgi:hypothetical protein
MKLPRVPPTAAGVTSGRGQGADPSGPPADRGEMPEAGAMAAAPLPPAVFGAAVPAAAGEGGGAA